mmetsp:Transcript_10889/g.31621  ORF Transcript_10889/g.31621 Transcript_10889/m.31621 type:complete len:227 (+) Transcript_10889:2155-2835(+)
MPHRFRKQPSRIALLVTERTRGGPEGESSSPSLVRDWDRTPPPLPLVAATSCGCTRLTAAAMARAAAGLPCSPIAAPIERTGGARPLEGELSATGERGRPHGLPSARARGVGSGRAGVSLALNDSEVAELVRPTGVVSSRSPSRGGIGGGVMGFFSTDLRAHGRVVRRLGSREALLSLVSINFTGGADLERRALSAEERGEAGGSSAGATGGGGMARALPIPGGGT